MYWLRLIRWNNLLIILLTQLLAWWCVIVPLQEDNNLLLTPINFSLLCLSTILIAAAGYIINDYFDIRIDTINKPEKVILEKQIPRRLAIIVHSLMNGFALILAGIVAWQEHHLEFILLQAACTFLLWKYSTTWKRQFMVGNVVVAVMTTLSIATLILYEPVLRGFVIYYPEYSLGNREINPVWVLYYLCFFAFALTWMREIVKDMEDYKGDAEEGCVTMPIKWGLQRSVHFTRVLGIVSLLGISIAALFSWLSFRLLGLYIWSLFAAILVWLIFVDKNSTKEHYHLASRYLKIIMVFGIGSLLIYRFQYG